MQIAICRRCQTTFFAPDETFCYCAACNDEPWEQWEADQAGNLREIEELQKQGHPHHCACRQVWGDGQCECDLYKQGYAPYAWLRRKKDD